MRYGSLFAGIGGFDLGFERAGMKCEWQVEIDDYATKVLEKHWPNVKRYRDVREVGKHNLKPVDVICGGFPCQDISPAGTKAGIDGTRSGLWSEYARIISELRPRYAVVENSSALLSRGMGKVLGDLAAIGYDSEWEVLSACQFGAPHSRERVFLIAYPDSSFVRTPRKKESKASPARLYQCSPSPPRQMESWWSVQPEPCSVVYGVPGIVDELRPYGNAVVPQVAEWIGRRIMEAI